MDVIKADQADIKQVVATMGTALSKNILLWSKTGI